MAQGMDSLGIGKSSLRHIFAKLVDLVTSAEVSGIAFDLAESFLASQTFDLRAQPLGSPQPARRGARVGGVSSAAFLHRKMIEASLREPWRCARA